MNRIRKISKLLPQYYSASSMALFYTMLLSAALHLTIALFNAVRNGDVNQANMFHILGFDMLWPELGKGSLNAAISTVAISAVWFYFYIMINRHKK